MVLVPGRCHVDIFVAPRTVIEVQGCFWHKHACQKPQQGWTAADRLVQAKDDARFAFLRSEGYVVMQIWECELEEHPEKVLTRLKKLHN